ncbi:MAG: TMEM198/TM7SF3 family protein [Phycisphaerales bacterium]|nr:TMEM198/TM7SF3 family protein [Phycisphaerales bacterium]
MHGVGTIWSAVSSSSSGATALAGVMVAFGLVLWLGGYRVMRALLVLLGITLGAAAGVLTFRSVSADVLASSLVNSAGGGSSPLVAAIIGAVLGGILGYISHRPLVAGLSALIIGAASVGVAVVAFNINLPMPAPLQGERVSEQVSPVEPSLVSVTHRSGDDESLDAETLAALARLTGTQHDALSLREAPAPRADARSDASRVETYEPLSRLFEQRAQPATGIEAVLPQSLREAVEPTTIRIQEASASLQASWNDVPTPTRSALTIAAAIGIAMGVLLGVLWSRLASGLVTAVVGAAAWLIGASVLAASISPSAAAMLDQPTWMLLSAWAGAALVGTAWQWRLIARRGPAAATKTA